MADLDNAASTTEKIEALPIKAYMPGVVAICEKNVGDAVEEGEVILILEAMKMENLITAPICGKVLSLAVKEGEKVGRGALLAMIG